MVAIVIALSVAPIDFQSSSVHAATNSGQSPAHDGQLSSNNRFANSLEYEFPAPPEAQTEERCTEISLRFCQWIDSYGSLIRSPSENGGNSSADLAVASNHAAGNAVGWRSPIQSSARATPVEISVPSLTISANIEGVGINSDREMEVPDSKNTVGWYRYGPAPGETGSAEIAGHLDDSRGRSAFFHLQDVEVGSSIIVASDDGSKIRFRVSEKRSYDATSIPGDKLFAREGEPVLALITCGGRWHSSAGRYSQTVVVYATPAAN